MSTRARRFRFLGLLDEGATVPLGLADQLCRADGRNRLAWVAHREGVWSVARLAFTADATNGRMLAWMTALGAECVAHAGVAIGTLPTRRVLTTSVARGARP